MSEDFELTSEQKRWLDGLKRHLKKMPGGIELLFGHGCADAFPENWYMENIYNAGTDMLQAGDLIADGSVYRIIFDSSRIRPNSESI